MQKEVIIMNVRFNNVTMNEAVNFVINDQAQSYMCTPNPEMLLEAKTNPKFLSVLNRSAMNVADGIGILWAATIIYKQRPKIVAISSLPVMLLFPSLFRKVIKERVTGSDLLVNVCKKAATTNKKIFFLGAGPGIAKKAAKILTKKIPNLQIVGTYEGSPAPEEQNKIVDEINKVQPDILFVAYGAPKQEIWISETLPFLKSVKKAIGIGGAFDFVTGKRSRAPKPMQLLGVEWLFRLIQEPKRIKRILNAIIKFPIEIIKNLN